MRRRSLVGTLTIAAVALGLAAPQLAQSAPRQDPRAEREQVRAEKARVAADIDTDNASLAEIDAALQTLSDNLATQEAALTRTQDEVAAAEQDIADAKAAITKLDAKIVVLRDTMRERAVSAYVSPPGDDVLTVLETNDFTTASARKFYIELRASSDADVADQLDGTLADLDYQKTKAADAKDLAETKRAEQQTRTDAVRTAKADQETVATRIEDTVDANIARSLELASTDRKLSQQIEKEQAELVARLEARRAADEAAAASAATAAAEAEAEAEADAEARPAPQQPRPSAPVDRQDATPTPTPSPSPAPTPSPTPPGGGGGQQAGEGGISLCYAGPIQVNCLIRDDLARMMAASAASGLVLSGGGYRSQASQIQLRKQNCGTSYYAIYEAPSSSCSPPTAKPGGSNHQLGLAIDFRCNGSGIGQHDRSNPCVVWLTANAQAYGFYNLPSEAWHWSRSGG